MANGGVIPSATQGQLSRATENILNAMFQKRRLDLLERQVGLQERSEATGTLISLLPLMPEGTTVADFPSIQGLVKRAVPEMGNDLGVLELNRTTLADLMDQVVRSRIESGEFNEEDLDRITSNVVGLGPTTEEERTRGAEATRLGQEAQIGTLDATLQGLRTISQDPEVRRDFARVAGGLDPLVKFTDPLTGKEMEFSSETAAGVWASLMRIWADAQMAQLSASVELSKLSDDEMEESREQLYKMAGELGVALSTPLANQMLNAFQNQMIGASKGEYEEGEGPFTDLYSSFLQKAEAGGPKAQAAMDALTLMNGFYNTVRTGSANMFNMLGQSIGGVEALKGIALGNALQSSGWPKEEIPGQVANLLKSFDEAGIVIGLDFNTAIGRNRFKVKPLDELMRQQQDLLRQQSEGDPAGSTAQQESQQRLITLLAIANMLMSGTLSEEQLIQNFGEERVNEAKSLINRR